MGFLDGNGVTTLVGKLKDYFQLKNEAPRAYYATSDTVSGQANKRIVFDGKGFSPVDGSIVVVTFEQGNTLKAQLGLNVDGWNNSDVKKDGELTSASNPLLWDDGDTLIFLYDNDSFNYCSTAQYILPKASTTKLGGVMVDGTTVTIDSNGVISAQGDSSGGGADLVIRCNSSSEDGLSSNASDYEIISGSVVGVLTKAYTSREPVDIVLYAYGGDHIEDEYLYQVYHADYIQADGGPYYCNINFHRINLFYNKAQFVQVVLYFEGDMDDGYSLTSADYANKYCTITNS